MAIKQIQATQSYQDPAGNVLANGFITLDLSQPAVATGSGDVAPMRVSITLDATGKFAATNLWANDQLTPSGTTYLVLVHNSNGLQVANLGQLSIQGVSPIDISQITPNVGGSGVSVPGVVLLNPSVPQTITGQPLTLTASAPLTVQGTATFKNINTIRFADQFPGATADVQITNAIADLPATGGIIDARGYGATTQTIAAVVTLGSATKPVTLLVSQQTRFNVTVTGGVCAVAIANGSSVITDGLGQQLGGVSTAGGFFLGAAANVSAIFCNADVTGAQEFFYLRGVVVQGNATATVTSGLIDMQGVFVNSVVRDVYTQNCFAKCLRLRPGTTTLKTMSDVVFDNNNFDATGTAGGIPVSIENLAASNIADLTFIGGAIEHAGSGQSLLVINGAGIANGIYNIHFKNVHFETTAGGAASAISLIDAAHVSFDGLTISGTPATNVVNISQTVANLTHDIEIKHLRTTGAWTNTINNAVNSTTVQADVADYYFAGGTGGAGGTGAAVYDVVPNFRSGLVAPTVGPSAAQQHTLPAVASDTVTLLAATQTLTNKTLNVPLPSGTGLQIFNTTTTCTTAASVGATCTTAAISLPVAEADTNYRVACTGKGITNVPVVIATSNSSATQFTITIAALTAAAATFSSYDCVAGHN